MLLSRSAHPFQIYAALIRKSNAESGSTLIASVSAKVGGTSDMMGCLVLVFSAHTLMVLPVNNKTISSRLTHHLRAYLALCL